MTEKAKWIDGKSEIFMTCLRVYKETFDRLMLEERPVYNFKVIDSGELDAIANLSASLLGVNRYDLQSYFYRCVVSWDKDKYVYYIPDYELEPYVNEDEPDLTGGEIKTIDMRTDDINAIGEGLKLVFLDATGNDHTKVQRDIHNSVATGEGYRRIAIPLAGYQSFRELAAQEKLNYNVTEDRRAGVANILVRGSDMTIVNMILENVPKSAKFTEDAE